MSLQGWLPLVQVQVLHIANLITLKPRVRSALQATSAALLDQVTAPKQYALPGHTQKRAGILASNAQLEPTIQLRGEHPSMLV